MSLQDVLKSATQDGNVMEKIDKAAGTYEDKVANNTDAMSKLPQSSLPTGTDPSPFSIGPLGSK